MVPPTQTLNLDITAISGILGSISIACWIVVFSPQIIENFKRSSANGLSLEFIIIWLAGDVFNILGAILQGVLPTMIILAIYYTLADIVLLVQCLYYRGFTTEKNTSSNSNVGEPSERTGLLPPGATGAERRPSTWSDVSAAHLSPAVPLHEQPKADDPPAIENLKPKTRLQAIFHNTLVLLVVFAAGILGWYLSNRSQGGQPRHHKGKGHEEDEISFNRWGQIFGYLCAVLYLASRVPQILLNFRRKSTEGVSFLFFLLACFGNLTYVLSIFAFEPRCHAKHGRCQAGEASAIYARYILINASWIAGSLGTLFLDLVIFVQFFMYRQDELDEEAILDNERDHRPLLSRGDSEF